MPSIGGLIFALHQKPSKQPMKIAAIASGFWAAVGILLGWAMLAPELQRAPTFLEMLTRPTAITLAATVILPIAMFWLLALLISRAQELKLMSSAMTEVAIRLAEPDRMAEQQVASVGQAVRRQVNFMNEAIGRALGRANELESMVQTEVASLERAYMQNEHRIRGLLQELSGERHALLNTSERVNVSLRELGNEIPQLLERLSDQQVKLARFIEEAGQNVVSLETTLNTSSANLATSIGTRTQELSAVLTDSTNTLQGLLVDKASEIQGQIAQRTDEMQTVFDSFSQGLDQALGARTVGLQAVLEEYTRALDHTMQSRHQALDQQLVERTKVLDDAFAERLKVFDDSILRSTIAIDSMVADKARALSTALETHAKEIGQVLGRQAGELDQQLLSGVNAVRLSSQNVTKQSLKAIEGLAGQAELLRNVSENLVNQIQGVSSRFDQQGQTIMRAANALETANYRIDKTLQNRQEELAKTLEHLSGKTAVIDQTLRGYSESLEGTFNDAEARARIVGEQLTRGAEQHSRAALQEIEQLRVQAETETDKALSELRARFSHVSREVTEEIGSLSTRFADSSDEMRRRAQSTIAELEGEQARLQQQLRALPEATRQSAEAMRSSLQDQLKALEQLSTLSHREAIRAEVSPPVAPHPHGPTAHPRSISSVTQSLANEMGYRGAPLQQAALPAPMPPPPAGTPSSQRAAGAGADAQRDGWKLGDLLARASQAEPASHAAIPAAPPPPPPPPAAANPLNIKTLARALDPTTASAIWSRFRNGQRGVMVRSIYTVEGRATFDEVQRRYKADAAFTQTVNGFMHDFEAILRDADQKDPSGRTAQNYIVSDSGRVYLFLAHASGRLA